MTKQFSNYSDLLTFTRASKGHALRPVSYGDELVENGTFDDNIDGWTDSNDVGTIAYNSAGAMDLARNSGTGISIATQTISALTVGKLYEVSFDVTAVSGAVRIRLDDQIFTTTPNHTAGVFSFSFVATVSSSVLTIDLRNSATSTATIDYISVKEVTFDQPDGTLTLFEHPEGVPRVEYDADGNRLGLLVEEQRVNLVPYSEDLTNSGWNKGAEGVTVTSSTTVAPNGVSGCSRVQFTAGSRGSRYVHDILTPSPLASVTHTVSAWVKSTSGADQTFSLKCTHGGVADYFSADFTATSEWQRFDFSQAFGTGGTSSVVGIAVGSAGDAADLEVWGFQFEADASFPTSYIKSNSGSTTTRSADVASIPVADFGYNQSAGTVLFEFEKNNTGGAYLLDFEGSVSSQIQVVNDGDLRVRATRSPDVNLTLESPYVASASTRKIAYTLKSGGHSAVLDGGSAQTSASTNATSEISTLYIGSDGGADLINGHIKSIKYYPRRLSNAQLVELTS
jgi:hypothetical protein